MKPLTILVTFFFAFAGCSDPLIGSNGNESKKDTASIGGNQKADSLSANTKKDQHFSSNLGFGKILFHVYSPNNVLHNSIIIQPSGIKDSSLIQTGVMGDVIDAFTADLNSDGYPEIYYAVFTQAKELNLFGYGSEQNNRLTPVYMPDINKDKRFGHGHMIGDHYKIEGGRLERSFPVYNDQDPMSSPSGGKRMVSYRLITGKNGWILKPVDAKELR